ncbi:MAG: hypothetical protein EOL97_13695 [Spirochaetia bacterium]|nr:hypothetical protein [Spirochaetia bacterium]
MKKLLITLDTQLRRDKETSDYWKEPWMFYEVRIANKIIFLGNLELNEDEVRNAADIEGLSLAAYLSKHIKNNTKLYNYCKKHRLGYNYKVFLGKSKGTISKNNEINNWKNFLYKKLRQKKDIEGLKELEALNLNILV